jgi:DNA polymerase-3 subunit epsilon
MVAWLERLWSSPVALDERRWVVLDVETSGLDPARDRLLAIAAIGLAVDWMHRRLEIVTADSFEVVLRQDQVSSHDNILLHGIGQQRQRDGVPAAQALEAFRQFVGASPLLAFHAAFDQAMIERALRSHLHQRLPNPWLDIEHLCAVTHEGIKARSLDQWMAHFSVQCAVRHQAAADTQAECELLLRIWPQVARQCGNWQDMVRLADSHRWIRR